MHVSYYVYLNRIMSIADIRYIACSQLSARFHTYYI